VKKIQDEKEKLKKQQSEGEAISEENIQKIMNEMKVLTDGLNEMKETNQKVEDQLKRVQEEKKGIEDKLDGKKE